MASTPSNEAFPESELPKWLVRKFVEGCRRAVRAMRPQPYHQLAQFAHDLQTCCQSGVDIVRGLELCLKAFRKTPFRPRWSDAVDQVRRGASLAEALRGAADLLPPFFLPVIKAGELSGRLDEALEFLERHCRLLAGPASSLRNVWLFPLAIMVAGSLIQVLMHLLMGSPLTAASAFFQELFGYLQLFAIVAVVMLTPVRYFFDQLRLSLPWIGALEREIALNRFFRVLALLYSVGDHRVESMIRTAAETVSNSSARLQLLRAARAIEQQASIPDAFQQVDILTPNEQATIEVGDLSGTLEKSFERISDDTGASMVAKLNFIQPILVRIVMSVVILSLIGTLLGLLF